MTAPNGVRGIAEKVATHALSLIVGVIITAVVYIPSLQRDITSLQRDIVSLQISIEAVRKKTDRMYEKISILNAELSKAVGVIDTAIMPQVRNRIAVPAKGEDTE